MKKYIVKFYYHTYGTITVEAENEKEAIELADQSNIENCQLLENLQEDNDPDVEEL